MSNKFQDINIKSHRYYFVDDIINQKKKKKLIQMILK